MKVKKSIIFTIAVTFLLSISAALFSACNKPKHYTLDAPEEEYIVITAFEEFIDVQVTYVPHDDVVPLFMISSNDGKWVEANGQADETSNPSPKFTHRFVGLTVNTEYTLSVKYRGNEMSNDSAPYVKTLKTLKYAQENIPEVSFKQANKKITIEKDAALEYSFDGGETYGDENEFTYADKGEKTVKVRYKETEQRYASAAQTISVEISDYYGGHGTKADPYKVATYEQLKIMKSSKGIFYWQLVADITFPAEAVEPLGPDLYSCHFDGNGYKMINPYVKQQNGYGACGIFVDMGSVKNLTVENAKIEYATDNNTNNCHIGIIAGRTQILENCKVSGEISVTFSDDFVHESFIGGAVGRMRSTLLGSGQYKAVNSFSDVTINYNSPNNTSVKLYVGGLFGADEMMWSSNDKIEVSGCGTNAEIQLLNIGTTHVGGLVGRMVGNVTNCYSKGSIVTDGVQGNTSMGGISAYVGNGNIVSCYSSMNLSANGREQNVFIGGIAMTSTGTAEYELRNCLYAGNIAITEGSEKVAMSDTLVVGVLPQGYTVTNCYHSDNLVSPVATEKTTAVAEETAKSAAWLQETLLLSSEIWNFVDGEYPTLK